MNILKKVKKEMDIESINKWTRRGATFISFISVSIVVWSILSERFDLLYFIGLPGIIISIGIYKKSRVCAVLLFIPFLFAFVKASLFTLALLAMFFGKGADFKWIFLSAFIFLFYGALLYLYKNTLVSCFRYHKFMKSQDSSYKPVTWRFFIGLLLAFSLIVIFKNLDKNEYTSFYNHLGAFSSAAHHYTKGNLEPRERIKYVLEQRYERDGEIKEELYIVTNRRLISKEYDHEKDSFYEFNVNIKEVTHMSHKIHPEEEKIILLELTGNEGKTSYHIMNERNGKLFIKKLKKQISE